MYKIHEFAELAGVTVRALHHYDRLGLLKPRRTESGYRVYDTRDLALLEQIVVLKFLGLPLKEIGELLKRESNLLDSLRRQQTVLAEKRGQLDAAIGAIQKAEKSLSMKSEPDWTLFTKIIKEIEMQNDTDWSKQYYSEEAKAAIEERKALWSPELQERVSRDWAARWKELVGEFTGGNPEIQKGLKKMYSDQDNWPAKQKQNWAIKPEIMNFIMAAMKCGQT